MREEVLLKDVPEGYFAWSPAEDYLIYSPDDKGNVSAPLKRLLHPDDRIPDARSRNYLVKYDPATGLSERLTYGSHAVYLNDISSDGRKLYAPLLNRYHSMSFLPHFHLRGGFGYVAGGYAGDMELLCQQGGLLSRRRTASGNRQSDGF